jgi:hypothetical protein
MLKRVVHIKGSFDCIVSFSFHDVLDVQAMQTDTVPHFFKYPD